VPKVTRTPSFPAAVKSLRVYGDDVGASWTSRIVRLRPCRAPPDDEGDLALDSAWHLPSCGCSASCAALPPRARFHVVSQKRTMSTASPSGDGVDAGVRIGEVHADGSGKGGDSCNVDGDVVVHVDGHVLCFLVGGHDVRRRNQP
jgi:hypothetical protein